MNVLLIQPPVEDFYQTAIRTYPLGLLYVAAVLKEKGYTVEVLDAHTIANPREVKWPEPMMCMKPYYLRDNKSPFRLFSQYYHFGLLWDELRMRIEEIQPDVVGIASLFTPYADMVYRIADICKQVDQRMMTVVGGAHVHAMPEHVLAHPSIDFILFGEGEYQFPRLLEGITNRTYESMAGIGYKSEGKQVISSEVVPIADLNRLPFPLREAIHPDEYCMGKKRYAAIVTSRGCPFTCTFCSVHSVMGKQFRMRDPEHVLKEIEECITRWNIRIFDIEDDNFTVDRERALTILRLLAALQKKTPFEIMAMNGVSLVNIDDEMLDAMKCAGFQSLNIAPVVSDRKHYAALERPTFFDEYRGAIKRIYAHGMTSISYAIVGFPGDTIDHFVDTISALAVEPTRIGASVFYPTPGTALYHELEKEGRVSRNDYAIYRSSVVSFVQDDFTRTDVMTCVRLVRMVNRLKEWCDAREHSFSLGEEVDRILARYETLRTCGVKNEGEFFSDTKFSEDDLVAISLKLFYETHAFYHIRCTRQKDGYAYRFTKEVDSEKVIACFMTKTKGKAICGERSLVQCYIP